MQEVCAVFDILPHQIKLVIFDKNYEILNSESVHKSLIIDEDGNRCEDLIFITNWIKEKTNSLKSDPNLTLRAVNFSTYGSSLVHLDSTQKPIAPLYDYNKHFGYKNRNAFLESHGAEEILKTNLQIPEISFENTAFQLFWIKKNKAEIFKKIRYSVSLGQYLQGLFTHEYSTEFTTLGSHSGAWDFTKGKYAEWLEKENLRSLCLPIVKTSETKDVEGIHFGSGIFNKTAALLPLLATNHDQFVLLSTGLWTVCINPFNSSPVNIQELNSDGLNILNTEGKTLRMARLFSGDAHNRQIAYLSNHFNLAEDACLNINFDPLILRRLRKEVKQVTPASTELGSKMDCPFMERNINIFGSIEDAYHQFIMDLIAQQIASIKLTFDHQINRKIYVDGGLAKNEIFMQLLAEAFHDKSVLRIGYEHTAALGAALTIGKHWTDQKIKAKHLDSTLVE